MAGHGKSLPLACRSDVSHYNKASSVFIKRTSRAALSRPASNNSRRPVHCEYSKFLIFSHDVRPGPLITFH
jgi:hypothetical protein